MYELIIILLILTLAVAYLARRYSRTLKQADGSCNGCGDDCGCCSYTTGAVVSGCDCGSSPFKMAD